MNFQIDKTYSWDEVSDVHRAQHGIYQKNGVLISLLTDFGKINPCFPDSYGETNDTIDYTGSGRRGDQKVDIRNRALLDAVEEGTAVPLFNKLGVDRWQFLGNWTVSEPRYVFDENQNRMLWKFTLTKVKI
ncbi:MAG TPA: hypothetical protein PKA82_08795 [Pyrinomonadaceae bacterium]|nr:hypothetical protein [Pyrinomonadaceae bacterium]